MENFWKVWNSDSAKRYNITCTIPNEPVIFYNDGSWVPIRKASKRQLERQLSHLHDSGFIGDRERSRIWSYPAPQGEMAYDMWEAGLEQMDEMTTHPLIDEIEEELKRRKSNEQLFKS